MGDIKGMVKLMPCKVKGIDGEEFLQRQWKGDEGTAYWVVMASRKDCMAKEIYRIPVKHCGMFDALAAWDLAYGFALSYAHKHGLFFDVKGSPRYEWDPEQMAKLEASRATLPRKTGRVGAVRARSKK